MPEMRKRFPELHVYNDGMHTTRVFLRNEGRDDLDLTDWYVLRITRVIAHGDLPECEVAFMARLIEHQTDA